MSLNIKNEEVHELVRTAAKLTGKSQTSVVEEALRRYLRQVQTDARMDRLKELMAEIDRTNIQLRAEGREYLDPDDLYDPATGLPA
jgi:antitoxin VapB